MAGHVLIERKPILSHISRVTPEPLRAGVLVLAPVSRTDHKKKRKNFYKQLEERWQLVMQSHSREQQEPETLRMDGYPEVHPEEA